MAIHVGCMRVQFTVLIIIKLTIEPQPYRNRFQSFFYSLVIFANRQDPGETPSNSASHQDPIYLQLRLFCITQWMYGLVLIKPNRNRTATEPEYLSIYLGSVLYHAIMYLSFRDMFVYVLCLQTCMAFENKKYLINKSEQNQWPSFCSRDNLISEYMVCFRGKVSFLNLIKHHRFSDSALKHRSQAIPLYKHKNSCTSICDNVHGISIIRFCQF